jgi:hypothetical protein
MRQLGASDTAEEYALQARPIADEQHYYDLSAMLHLSAGHLDRVVGGIVVHSGMGTALLRELDLSTRRSMAQPPACRWSSMERSCLRQSKLRAAASQAMAYPSARSCNNSTLR